MKKTNWTLYFGVYLGMLWEAFFCYVTDCPQSSIAFHVVCSLAFTVFCGIGWFLQSKDK